MNLLKIVAAIVISTCTFFASNLIYAQDDLWIDIVKKEYTLYLKSGDKVVEKFQIAIGANPGQKQHVGDMTTPTGDFYIEEIIPAHYWTHDFKDGKGEIAGAYGPWFLSLKTPWDGIGIHGTHDPNSVGTMASEGCVRMHNEDIIRVKEQSYVGMRVVIREE